MEFLNWLESLSYSVWVRESPSLWAFPALLFVHTLGMSLVAGGSAVISMALLGFWPKTALKPLERLYPGDVVRVLDQPVHRRLDLPQGRQHLRPQLDLYVKLVFVICGVALLSIMRKQVFGDPASIPAPVSGRTKMLAWASLACWFCAIVAGRLIAYVGPVPGL